MNGISDFKAVASEGLRGLAAYGFRRAEALESNAPLYPSVVYLKEPIGVEVDLEVKDRWVGCRILALERDGGTLRRVGAASIGDCLDHKREEVQEDLRALLDEFDRTDTGEACQGYLACLERYGRRILAADETLIPRIIKATEPWRLK